MYQNRPKLWEYVLNSPTRWLGVFCLFLGIVFIYLMFEVMNQSNWLNTNRYSEGQTGFFLGMIMGLVGGPFLMIGFMSKLWGRVTALSGLAKISVLAYVLYSGQGEAFSAPFIANPWLFLLVNIDGIILAIMLINLQNRRVGDASLPDIEGARQAHTDYVLRANTLNSWIVGSSLADHMQSVRTRRVLSILMVASVVLFVCAFLVSFHDPIMIAAGVPAGTPDGERFDALFGMETYWIVQSILFLPVFIMFGFQMALRPLMALNDEPLDERQVQIIRFAHADGRVMALLMLGLMVLLPLFGAPRTVIAPIALGGFAMAWLMPYLLMAWTLPDGDGSYDENEDHLEIDYA